MRVKGFANYDAKWMQPPKEKRNCKPIWSLRTGSVSYPSSFSHHVKQRHSYSQRADDRSFACPAFEHLYRIWVLPLHESGEQGLPPRREDVSARNVSLTTLAARECPMHSRFMHQRHLCGLWMQREGCQEAGTTEPLGTVVAAARQGRGCACKQHPASSPSE